MYKRQVPEPYILRYAARPVFPGQLVEVSTQLETGNYSYLLIKENGETELFAMDGARPFMSKQTKSLLEIPQESTLYCLEEVRDFCKTFPLAAGDVYKRQHYICKRTSKRGAA